MARELTDEEKEALETRLKKDAEKVTMVDVEEVLDKGTDKADSLMDSGFHFIIQLAKRIRTLYYLLRDWWMGRYMCPWTTIGVIVAAILYFLSPVDLIPDFIPVIGYLDDAAVVAFAIGMIDGDLQAYCLEKGISKEKAGLE